MRTEIAIQDQLDDLFRCLEGIDKSFKRFGLSAIAPTNYSVEKFLTLPEEHRGMIETMIKKYDVIMGAEKYDHLSSKEIEVVRLKHAAEEFNLKIVDENLFSLIDDGDVVEIYDHLGRQIYRNLTFCKLSSYSLLDVAVNTWQELYERPANTIEGIYGRVVEQLTTDVLTQSYDVEKHVLKERFIYSKRQRVFLMDMKYISPLEDRDAAKRVGVISVAKVQVIADNGKEIEFI